MLTEDIMSNVVEVLWSQVHGSPASSKAYPFDGVAMGHQVLTVGT
jgi:hypothetical protein